MTPLIPRHELARTTEQPEAAPLWGQRFGEGIVNSFPGIYYLFDEQGTMLRWNENLERVTGYVGAEVAAMSPLRFFRLEQQAEIAAVIRSAFVEGAAHVEADLIHRDGQTTPYLFSARRVTVAGQSCLAGTGADLSERKRTEAALAESEQKFRQLAEHIDAVFWVSDLDKGEMAYISPAYETVWGRSCESLYRSPKSFIDAMYHEDRARVTAAFALQVQGDYDETYRVMRPDGSVRWVRDRAFPICNKQGTPYRIVGFAEDITEYKRASETLAELNHELEARVEQRTADLATLNEKLAYDAFHDALTGLPNRARFMDHLGRALGRVRSPFAPRAVLFLDLDDFKRVNDSLGHAAGDALLVQVARRIETCLRPDDLVARLGGDEFAISLGYEAEEDVDQVAKRLVQDLGAFSFGGLSLHISASIGVVLCGAGSDEVTALLRDADIAMYQAKAQGKGRCARFEPAMREQAQTRLALEAELRSALAQGELEVFYQPIVALTGALVGFEALVRWQHPERGLVPPGDFIPLAEETGLIVALDRFVLETACAQVRNWQHRYDRGLTLSVNLSGRQFAQPDLASFVQTALHNTGFEAAQLHLELTESLLITGSAQVAESLSALRSLGVELHLDDFGTGYSSLSYLQRFSAHTIKIDRAFIRDLTEKEESATLVRTIVLMANALGMMVIAEGVETEAQFEHLKALNCDFVQGFLFGKPLPAAEAEEHLAFTLTD